MSILSSSAATVVVTTLDDPIVRDNADLFSSGSFWTVDINGDSEPSDDIDPDSAADMKRMVAVLVILDGKVIAAEYMRRTSVKRFASTAPEPALEFRTSDGSEYASRISVGRLSDTMTSEAARAIVDADELNRAELVRQGIRRGLGRDSGHQTVLRRS